MLSVRLFLILFTLFVFCCVPGKTEENDEQCYRECIHQLLLRFYSTLPDDIAHSESVQHIQKIFPANLLYPGSKQASTNCHLRRVIANPFDFDGKQMIPRITETEQFAQEGGSLERAAHFMLGVMYQVKKDLDRSLNEFKLAEKDSNLTMESLASEAGILGQTNRFSDAAETMRQLQKLGSKSHQTLVLGSWIYENAGERKAAIECYEGLCKYYDLLFSKFDKRTDLSNGDHAFLREEHLKYSTYKANIKRLKEEVLEETKK